MTGNCVITPCFITQFPLIAGARSRIQVFVYGTKLNRNGAAFVAFATVPSVFGLTGDFAGIFLFKVHNHGIFVPFSNNFFTSN